MHPARTLLHAIFALVLERRLNRIDCPQVGATVIAHVPLRAESTARSPGSIRYSRYNAWGAEPGATEYIADAVTSAEATQWLTLR